MDAVTCFRAVDNHITRNFRFALAADHNQGDVPRRTAA
ncbi:MAG: hypothetical protein JWN45_3147 [Acidobacteriaceae bacterium]|jgi:hypothetical protein|nr:hypothetical protein [Acidobacteriaceae bacterium]